MNGELNELYGKLDKRIALLEQEIKLNWKQHDRHSEERHSSNLQKFDKIFSWLEALPCRERSSWLKAVSWQLKAVWAILIGVILKLLGVLG